MGRRRLNLPAITADCTATVHRTWAAYEAGCRCPDITARIAERRKRWSHGTPVPSTVPPGFGCRNDKPDPAAVLRVTGGERLRLSTVDRRAAIDYLDRWGRSAGEIARRLGCSQRTVQRRRAQRRGQVAA